MSLDAGQQFTGAEGLDQIIVGAMLHAFDAGFFAGAGGKQDDRNSSGLWDPPQFMQQAEAVQVRHHHVGQD